MAKGLETAQMLRFYSLFQEQIEADETMDEVEYSALCDELDAFWADMSEDQKHEVRLFARRSNELIHKLTSNR